MVISLVDENDLILIPIYFFTEFKSCKAAAYDNNSRKVNLWNVHMLNLVLLSLFL